MEPHQGTYSLELEAEVAIWRGELPTNERAQADYHITLLAERGVLLGAPYTRQLRGKLRELRFYCGRRQQRISYYIATPRRIVLLTVFDKRRQRERAEIARADRMMALCIEEEHATEEHENYERPNADDRPGAMERGP